MNAYEAQIEKLAKAGLLPPQIRRKLALFEHDVYILTPLRWYMRAYTKPRVDISPDTLCLVIDTLLDIAENGKPRALKQCRLKLKELWLVAYTNYHGASMDIH